MAPNLEMDYAQMKVLYQAFDNADEVLKKVCDKLQAVADDTATKEFTGMVGPSINQDAVSLVQGMQKFVTLLQNYHTQLGQAEQTMRQGDQAGAQDLQKK